MSVYMNFVFRKLKVMGNIISGIFDAPDAGFSCHFIYNIKTKEYEILESNKPKEEIMPIPFYWLDIKKKENGNLRETESKISY